MSSNQYLFHELIIPFLFEMEYMGDDYTPKGSRAILAYQMIRKQ